MASNGESLGEIRIGASLQAAGEHCVVGRIPCRDGRDVAEEGSPAAATVLKGQVPVSQEGNRYDHQVADQIGHDIRTELEGAENDAQPKNGVADPDEEEPEEGAIDHAFGRRRTQHCVQSSPESRVPPSAWANHWQIRVPALPMNSATPGR